METFRKNLPSKQSESAFSIKGMRLWRSNSSPRKPQRKVFRDESPLMRPSLMTDREASHYLLSTTCASLSLATKAAGAVACICTASSVVADWGHGMTRTVRACVSVCEEGCFVEGSDCHVVSVGHGVTHNHLHISSPHPLAR